MNCNKMEWQGRVEEGEEWASFRATATYHDGVFGEALPHILYKFNKVFRVAIGNVQAYVFHLGNSIEDLFQLLKIRRACARAGGQMLKTVRVLAGKLFPLLEAVVFMDSREEGELTKNLGHLKGTHSIHIGSDNGDPSVHLL